jgi:tetratricopeptide (TPR) repeat protein
MYRLVAACLWVVYIADGTDGENRGRPSVKDLGTMAAQYYDSGARLHAAGNYRDAETQYARSIETWQKAYGTEHPGLIRLLNALAALCLESRQFDKAETAVQRALDIQRAAPGVMPPTDEAKTFIHLGSVYRVRHRFEESEAAYLNAEATLQREVAPDHDVLANAWNNLGALYAEWGRAERAASYLDRSVTQFGERCSQEAVTTLTNLAWISDKIGRPEAAASAFARSVNCAREAFGPTHRHTADTLVEYAKFLRARKQRREARRLEAEAREIRALVGAGDASRYVVDARTLQAKRR